MSRLPLVLLICTAALGACMSPQAPAPTEVAAPATSAADRASPQPVLVPTRTAIPISTLGATSEPTGAAALVQGSVAIEGGQEVTGGFAGEAIPLEVTFEATSDAGQVVDMRVGQSCLPTPDATSQPWEPFVPTRTYSTTARINFVGWYISVQYRDSQGNVSPVYCDDISVEGMPPPTP